MSYFPTEDTLYSRYKTQKIAISETFLILILKSYAVTTFVTYLLAIFIIQFKVTTEIGMLFSMLLISIYAMKALSSFRYLTGILISILISARAICIGIWRFPEYISIYFALSCFYLWYCHLEFIYNRLQGYITRLMHTIIWCSLGLSTSLTTLEVPPDVLLALGLFVILQLVGYRYRVSKDYEELVRKIELEMSDSNVRNLINAIPEGITVLNENLEVIMSNSASLKLIQGENILQLKIDAKFTKKLGQECYELLKYVMDFKESEEITTTFGVCAINNYYLECTGSKTKWNNEDAIVLTFREVPRIIKLQSEVSLNSKTLKILQGVSHELKTPLNKIINDHRAMIYSAEAITDCMKEHLIKSFNSAKHLLYLIKDMIDYSHIQFKNLELNFEWIAVDENILESIKMYQNINKRYNILYENEVFDLISIYTDKERLKQCLLNLIGLSLG